MDYSRVLAITFGCVLFLCLPGLVGAGEVVPGGEGSATIADEGNVTIAVEADTTGESSLLIAFETASADSEAAPAGTAGLQAQAEAAQTPLEQAATRHDALQIERQFWIANVALVTADLDRIDLGTIARIDGVREISENPTVRAASTAPAQDGVSGIDTLGAQSLSRESSSIETTYGLEQIGTVEAWESYGTQGEGASVAVLDTGIDPDHPDINLAGWIEFDAEGQQIDTEPQDYGDHGTHVSGTVAGGDASGTHIGVAPGVDLYHGAVLTDCDSDCAGTGAQILAGIEWAVEEEMDILSLSLGTGGYSAGYIDAIRNAHQEGTIVVAASGNAGEGTSGSPANIYDSIAVGATDSNRAVTSFSGGEWIETADVWGTDAPADWPTTYVVPDIVAPGAQVTSTVPGGGYGDNSGTSMATPHVAGAVALLQSATAERISAELTKQALRKTATKPDDWHTKANEPDTRYGLGIIHVPTAMEFVRGDRYLDAVNIEQEVVSDGEPITVTATVTNSQDTATSHTLELRANNSVVASETASFDPLETKSITFEHTFEESGRYSLTIDEQDIGLVTVEQPPTFEVGEMVLSTTAVKTFEPVNVTVDVTNTGDRAGTFEAELAANDTHLTTEQRSIEPGETATLTLEHSFDEPGEYHLSVNEAFLGTVVVESRERLAIATSPATFAVGNGFNSTETDVVLDVVNDGGSGLSPEPAGSLDLTELTITLAGNGTTITTAENLSLSSGETVALTESTAGQSVTITNQTVSDELKTITIPSVRASQAGQFDVTVTGTFGDGAVRTVSDHVDVGGANLAVEPAGALRGYNGTVAFTVTNGTDTPIESATVRLGVPERLGSENETFRIHTNNGSYDATALALSNGSLEVYGPNGPTTFRSDWNETDPLTTVSVETGENGTYDLGETVSIEFRAAAAVTASVVSEGTLLAETPDAFEILEPIDVTGDGNPASDTTGDGLLNDVTGDGVFNIFDVQALFDNLDSEALQREAHLFDFAGTNPDEVTIFDVQALFGALSR